jgi:large subunit ribosomal protein L4
MVTLPVYDQSGAEVGKYEIDPEKLAPRVSKQLLHDAVVMYQRNQRQGTSRTKSRAEVAGSTKKMYRQKGTGNARAGSRRSGVRRGGGHIFAIRPRDWTIRLPRKALQLATRMALASKIQDGQVTIVDQFSFSQPKTKEMVAILKALKCQGRKLLVATEGHSPLVYKSARNIDGVEVSPVSDLNAYIVLKPDQLVLTKGAMDAIRDRIGG